jgi:ribokinase
MADDFDVAVVGSLHLDIMVRGPKLPALDETVIGKSWGYKCGGKGGNQAMGAARAGARTVFAGAVGDDDFGRQLFDNLKTTGIDCSRIAVAPDIGSGMSVAIENADGGYGAVVVSGANRRIAEAQLAGLGARVLLLQNEIDPALNLAAARRFKARGALLVHNMAPFIDVDGELLALTDVVIVNRLEAKQMTGESVAAKAATAIAALGCDAIVTSGGEGLHLADRDGRVQYIPAVSVKVVSTHGAGDCFCGTLAAALARGNELADAARAAAAAAAALVSGGGR